MTTTANFPSERPTLLLDFAKSKKLDPRVTFTRASIATRTNNKGQIETVPSGVPRFDHDPITLECKGLLVEESRTNLLTYSEQFDNAAWAKANGSVTPNIVTAPDGTLTADKLAENTSDGNHYVAQTAAVVAGSTYTQSVYVKAAEKDAFWFNLTPSGIWNGAQTRAFFNLTTLAIASVTTGAAANIASVGNGWYRCSITAVATVSGNASIWLSLGATTTYTGDGTSGLYLWGAQLEAGAFPTSYIPSTDTFTGRTSTATYINSAGLIATAASGEARYSYNPLNLTVAPKLLLEGAATNLLQYSDVFNAAIWVKGSVTAIANTVTAPNGLLEADSICANTTFTSHNIIQDVSAITGTNSFSCYVKAGLYSKVLFAATGGTTPMATRFDLVLGTEIAENIGGCVQADMSGQIVAVGNGWYRCTMTWTATGQTQVRIYLDDGVSNLVFAGDTTPGIYIWGAQLEAGTYATSYIPTVASAVTRVADTSTSTATTRAADTALMTGTNFSDFYNALEGTFVVNGSTDHTTTASTFPNFATVHDGSFANRMAIGQRTIDHSINAGVTTGGVTQASMAITVAANYSTENIVAAAYKANDFAVYANNQLLGVDTSVVVSAVNRLQVGGLPNTGFANGSIRRIAYYPTRLPNEQLQALSTL